MQNNHYFRFGLLFERFQTIISRSIKTRWLVAAVVSWGTDGLSGIVGDRRSEDIFGGNGRHPLVVSWGTDGLMFLDYDHCRRSRASACVATPWYRGGPTVRRHFGVYGRTDGHENLEAKETSLVPRYRRVHLVHLLTPCAGFDPVGPH